MLNLNYLTLIRTRGGLARPPSSI